MYWYRNFPLPPIMGASVALFVVVLRPEAPMRVHVHTGKDGHQPSTKCTLTITDGRAMTTKKESERAAVRTRRGLLLPPRHWPALGIQLRPSEATEVVAPVVATDEITKFFLVRRVYTERSAGCCCRLHRRRKTYVVLSRQHCVKAAVGGTSMVGNR